MKTAAIALMALTLSGCAGFEPTPPVALTTAFDAAAFAWSTKPGGNTVTGDALLRTRGGDVKTCAGLNVTLLPATPYTAEYIWRRFGSEDGGYSGNVDVGPITLAPDLDRFRRSGVCDAQGVFTFANLPDGAYYVIATVTWEVPEMAGYYSYMSLQGGDIAKRVEVKGGETAKLTLTA